MSKLAAILAVVSLALPGAAAAKQQKPYLTIGRAESAIRAASTHVTIHVCTRQGRAVVTCTYSEPMTDAETGFEVVNEPSAVWSSWAVVRQGRHGPFVSYA